jgi:hypothetical protein
MPRLRRFVLLLSVLGSLLLPAPRAEAAHASFRADLTAVVTSTLDPTNPNHQNVTGQLTRLILDVLDFRRNDGRSVGAFTVFQAAGHAVTFVGRETLVEGRGRINPTETARALRTATGMRVVDSHGDEVCVEVRIEEHGQYHRVGTVATADLTLDAHVYRHVNAAQPCGTGDNATEHWGHRRFCVRADVTAVPRDMVAGLVEAVEDHNRVAALRNPGDD